MNILFYFVIAVLLLLIFKYYKDNKEEGFLNFTQCKKLHVAQRLTVIFKENDIKRDDKDWDLYLPCGYTYIESELREMSPLKKNQKIIGLDGCDKIVSKYFIWKTLVNKLGGHYTNYFPKTYPCSSDGITDLLKNHVDGNKYIAKKDVQRQTGLKIINNITEIKDVVKDRKFLVIQELLKNPLLIDNRKINIRVYFLIVCENNKVSAYIHENGFIYYTPECFDYDSTDDGCHITTGYIDRSVYEKNPLTIDNLYKYPNIYIAAGCNSSGIAMGGGIGKTMAELIIDKNTEWDISKLSLKRFIGQDINDDNLINILDIVGLVNIILEN